MDDFLHNLRTGKNKVYDRKRRTYDNPHGRMQDRQGNRNRRNFNQNRDLSNETLNVVRKALDEIIANQKKQAEIDFQRIAVEERKAEALEAILGCLQNQAGPVVAPPEMVQEIPAVVPEIEHAAPPLAEPATAEVVVLSRPEIIERIKKHRKKGLSYEKVALKLEEEGIQTLSGRGRWRGQTIYRLAQEG